MNILRDLVKGNNMDELMRLLREKFGALYKPFGHDERKGKGYIFPEGENNLEDSRANPDILDETETFYKPTSLSSMQTKQLESVRLAMMDVLTELERQIIELHGYEGLTQKETAKRLHITRDAVNSSLRKARRKILKKCRGMQNI